MSLEGRKFWILIILLPALIWSCYSLTPSRPDGTVSTEEGVEPVSETLAPEQDNQGQADEGELDLYALPFEELLEIQVASVY